MNDAPQPLFEFGGVILDPKQKIVSRNGELVRIAPKTFEILAYLASRPNEVITKEEIMGAVWQDSFVEDANLTVHISALRKLLASCNGGGPNEMKIETFPKVGYRFAGKVEMRTTGSDRSTQETNGDGQSAPPTDVQKVRMSALGYLLASAGFLLIAAVGYSLFSGSVDRLRGKQSMVPIIGMERTVAYAISPDGEYVAHAPNIDGQFPLYITYVASNSRIELLPPGPSSYQAMEFSGDGAWLFFIRAEADTTVLYKIKLIGASLTRLVDGVGIHFSISSNGDRICYRKTLETGETSIVLANVDGTEPRTVAIRGKSEPYSDFSFGLSPDGSQIASIVGGKLVVVDSSTGTETEIATLAPSGLGDGLKWLRDGSGVLASTSERDGLPSQLWLVDYPSGEVSRLTNDLNAYGRVDVSADGRTVISARYEDKSRTWVSMGSFDDFAPVSTTYEHRVNWIRWSGDTKIVFGSSAAGRRDIWIMNRDGSDEQQLTREAGNNVMPIVSPDGRYVVFVSNRADKEKTNLWRMNIDGSDPRKLTAGDSENQPSFSPDGRWVYFTSGKIDGPVEERRVHRVSIEGNNEKALLVEPSYGAAVSPDGKFFACWIHANEDSPWKIGIFPADGGSMIYSIDAQRGQPVKWTPDGKGIALVQTQKGVSNIWVYPVRGGDPVKITAFTNERILQFDWSSKNEIIVSRTERNSNIVMIRDFR